jgi:3-oxoacyl-[acyl-carrier protein] reductase
MDLGLKGKVALITGTNNPQGIGATTALAFVNEGVKVVLVYKKMHYIFDESQTAQNGVDRYHKNLNGNMEIVEQKLCTLSSDYLILESDISDENCVKEVFDFAVKRFGKVDILVNNAASYSENDTIETLTADTIDLTFNVNVKGTLLMSHEFIKRRGDFGRIINLSTDSAQVFAGQITYGASKATIEAFTRSIAMEVGKYGITVNCVSPGPTQTGWIDDKLEETCKQIIPLGKLIQPQDIADTILFLASKRAAMLTGQVIKVSGGHAL